MGIRIHKTLGYGIRFDEKDVFKPNYTEILHSLYDCGANKSGEVAEFIEAQYNKRKENKEKAIDLFIEMKSKLSSRYPEFFKECIHHIWNGDCTIGVIISPPTFAMSWHRYDNSIDYYEDAFVKNSTDGHFTYLDAPIYPYSTWVHPDSHEPVRGEPEFPEYMRSKGYIPMIPLTVQLLAQKVDFFREPDGWKHLRPVMATWWC